MKNKYSLLNIIILFILVLFLGFICYVVLDFKTIFKTLEEIQKTKIEEYIKAKNSVIEPLIKYKFYDIAQVELKKINKNIKYIEIKTPNFKYAYGKKNSNLKIIKMPLKYKNEKLGDIVVGYSDKDLLRKFSIRYFKKVTFYFIFVLLIFVFAYFFIKNKLSSLNKLAQKIEKINFKKVKNIELMDKYYEIKNITESINKLLNQINNSYQNQKKLIKEITVFRRQLETAQKIAEMFTWEYNCETGEFVTQNFHMKKKLGFKDFNEFLDSLVNKEQFFLEIKKACKENYEYELLLKVKNKENEEFYFKVQCKSVIKENKKNIIGVCINITEDIKKQEQIEYLAYHDSLTGLINRNYLKEQLNILLNITKRNNKKLAVVFIDLDNFKYINDTFGHDIGDMLLIEVSKRLKNSVRNSDIVSRIGGDEFILILNNIKNKSEVEKIMNKIKNTLIKPVYIKNHKLQTTFSAGISIFPDDAEDSENLLKFADIAMYESKKLGKNRFSFINENLKQEIKEYYLLVDELKDALKKDDELILYFQPKVNVQKEKVTGAEGLIRWKHPKKGLLTPNYFIDIAEKANIIRFIDDYVLEKGIETLKHWENDNYLKDLTLAINISANKFNEKNFVDNLKNLIKKYNINPEKLQIEITETISMQNIFYTINVLNEIKSLGVKIALDDFGTGYSSLNYLKKIPFDVLKIDQTFVKDMLKDRNDTIITKLIIEISKILNKTTVAEGVENKEILEVLIGFGVNEIQGYYFSKPLSEKKLEEYVANFDYNNYI